MERQIVAKVQRSAGRGKDNSLSRQSTPARQPMHPILSLQRTIGNQAVQRMLRSSYIQAKLTVNESGDKFEQEADRTSEAVMRAPVNAGPEDTGLSISRVAGSSAQRAEEEDDQKVQRASRGPLQEQPRPDEEFEESRSPMMQRQEEKTEQVEPVQAEEETEELQRQESGEEEEEEAVQTVQREESKEDEETVMTSRAGRKAPAVPRGFASLMRQSSGEGQPVPRETRGFFESRFGADFSSVRIHTGANATILNRSIQAKAFTRANHIYFSDGAYDPSSNAGKTLLAHELTHVVQQGHAQPAAGAHSASPRASTAGVLQRQEADDEGEARPTEEQKAAALAAAARAEKLAKQAEDYGKEEVAKSKQQKAEEKEAEQSASQEARAASGQAKEAEAKGKKRKKPEMQAAMGVEPQAPEEEAEGAEGVVKKAPSSPEEDPAFQKVVKRVGGAAKKQKSHASPQSKAAEAHAAAEAPVEEITGRAENTHAGEMEKAETPPFDAAAFKKQLMKRIEELTPKSLEEADDFKDDNKLAGVKEQMSGQVAEGKAASRGPLEAKKAEGPDTKNVEPKPVAPIPEPEPGAPPPGVGASEAAPKSKTEDEIETPIQENTKQIGGELEKENITEQQLAESNEPQFQEALASKRDAETHAAQTPQSYRQFEQGQLGQAEEEAAATAVARTRGMHAGRVEAFGQVREMQGKTKSKDEAARLEVGQHIHGIYEKTKAEVERILSELDGKVEKAFDEGAEAARKVFEDYVDAQMEAYKERRYGGWFGWARWAKDKLFGMPDEVNVFYERGRNLYLRKMDAVIDNVVGIIGADLTAAKAEIAKGRKELGEYLAGLPTSLQTVGAEAAEEATMLFDSLEENVNDKQGELIDTLAKKYHEHLKAVDERIEEMKAANRGLVDKAIDAVKAVIKTIIELKNLLFRVLAKIAEVVMTIIGDPIGFLGNLIEGLRLGFGNFVDKIWDHLKAGFIGWLTGALGSTRIQMPEDIFSVKGMFSILVQVLGLSWEFIRGKSVKLLGEPVVKALEGSFTLFQVLMREGPAGLWEFAKEKFSDLKEMLVDQIQNMLITQVIKAGIKWVIGLLNPVGAFIKAAMAIYEIVTFFIQKAKQIGEFISSLVDSVAEIARGNISAAAKKIEESLARALPLIIGFLASLLGISGLAEKVQKLFTSLRKRVEKFIDGLILKAKQFARKLVGKMSPDKRGKVVDEKEEKKHEAIVTAVANEMEKSPPEGTAYADLRAQKEKQAGSLINKYGKQLKPPMKLTISFIPPEEDREDDDMDFTVRIGPNDKKKKGAVKSKLPDLKVTHDKAVAETGHPELLKGHGKGIPGHEGHDFDIKKVRDPLDAIGYDPQTGGDHSYPDKKVPGSKPNPETKYGKKEMGSWTPDHQPYNSIVNGRGKDKKAVQFRFYPHAVSSLFPQAKTVSKYKNSMKKLRGRDDTNYAEGVDHKWFWSNEEGGS